MATHKQALKRHRQSLKRRDRNRRIKRTLATFVKKARAAVETAPAEATESVRAAVSMLARGASKGVIPKKRASRKISRLMKAAAHASKSN